MINDVEQKLAAYGETNLKLIRVTDGGIKNRFLGNMIIAIKHFKEESKEIFSVRIQSLNSARVAASMSDKFSLNKFEATVNHTDHSITIGPSQGIQVEEQLQNRGIGTYALNELLLALRNNCPNYSFLPYEVTMSENVSESKKALLEAFLAKFNIPLSFSDLERRIGTVRASTPQQVINHYNQDKIQEIDLEEFIVQLVAEKTKNDTEIANMKAEISRMGEETLGG
ncbi:MAG: hypothetical protein LBV09_06395, partial [Deferribacteraceae bacterium]|nr:hypothetical protein [Deferribacteraceae bacterium]